MRFLTDKSSLNKLNVRATCHCQGFTYLTIPSEAPDKILKISLIREEENPFLPPAWHHPSWASLSLCRCEYQNSIANLAYKSAIVLQSGYRHGWSVYKPQENLGRHGCNLPIRIVDTIHAINKLNACKSWVSECIGHKCPLDMTWYELGQPAVAVCSKWIQPSLILCPNSEFPTQFLADRYLINTKRLKNN